MFKIFIILLSSVCGRNFCRLWKKNANVSFQILCVNVDFYRSKSFDIIK